MTLDCAHARRRTASVNRPQCVGSQHTVSQKMSYPSGLQPIGLARLVHLKSEKCKGGSDDGGTLGGQLSQWWHPGSGTLPPEHWIGLFAPCFGAESETFTFEMFF